MLGIKNIKIKIFIDSLMSDDVLDDVVNEFLDEHNGNIIDIQYQKNNSVMVVYTDKNCED